MKNGAARRAVNGLRAGRRFGHRRAKTGGSHGRNARGARMSAPYLIGVDGGTESLRAFAFDLAGRPLGSHAAAYPTRFPGPGMAEQDPEDWWRALGEAVRGAVAAARADPGAALGLGLDTTCCSVVALDAQGKALRPCLLWMDVRAAAEAAEVAATGDAALMVNGAGRDPVSAEWMIPKALWLKRHEPALFDRAAMICEYQEFLNLRLTGRYAATAVSASSRWHWRDGVGWADGMLAALGLQALREKWPAEVLPAGAPIGGLTPAAAEHLGLRPGLMVGMGGSDAVMGMVGLGVARAGEMALITGSSHLHLGLSETMVHRKGMFGAYRNAVYPGLNLIEGGQTSTGSVVAWFKRHFAPNESWEALNAAAAAIAPGCEGVRALDHFQGNRTPWVDAQARGAFAGLSLSHGPAHLFRAILESVCLGTREIVRNFGDALALSRIVACGGATRSALWLQIHADALQAPIVTTEVADAPALGSAIAGGVAAGRFADLREGVAAMVRPAGVVEPDPAQAEVYAALGADYVRLYEALRAARA
jgi:ribulose kinase